MKEMRESVKIMLQCIDKIPEGSIMIENNKITPPKRSEMKHSMEAIIHHFK